MRQGIGAVIATAVLLMAAATAQAENQPHPSLNALVSEVAGKPVTVWCENSPYDWDRFVYSYSGGAQIGASMYGFTYMTTPVVYLSPQRCQPLTLALQYGYAEVGAIYLAAGLHTLIHEAAHQRGYTDEGQAECYALPLVAPLAERYFGLARTITVPMTQTVTRTMRRKIAGRWRKITYRTQIVVATTTPNPDYTRVAGWATAWHRTLPVNYQGGC
jgi:hypothetical protein